MEMSMRALCYLLITELKNRIFILKRKPAFLVLYGFVILMLIISVVALALSGNNKNMTYADERIIYAFIAGFGLLFLINPDQNQR